MAAVGDSIYDLDVPHGATGPEADSMTASSRIIVTPQSQGADLARPCAQESRVSCAGTPVYLDADQAHRPASRRPV